MAERIQKLIAAAGAASRRKAEAMIAEGRVRVNGRAACLGDTAEPTDRIELDGRPLAPPQQKQTYLLYKPRGYVTTLSDEKGRKTVAELLPQTLRLFPVGRLDLNSEGLLVMTNDGALANKLAHPSREIEKGYHLWVSGYTPQALALLRRPVELDGRRIRPPRVRPLWEKPPLAMLEVTIHEGRNRQIRRMCEAAGLNVTRLKRVREGALRLGALAPGEHRPLTAEELQYIQSL